MSEQVFADGIGPIVVVGGMVRLDFVTLVPDESEGGVRPKPVVQHRLFMPVEAFQAAAHRFAEAAGAIAKLEHQQAGAKPVATPPPVPPAAVAPVALATEPQPVAPPPPARWAMQPDEPPPSDRPKPPFP